MGLALAGKGRLLVMVESRGLAIDVFGVMIRELRGDVLL